MKKYVTILGGFHFLVVGNNAVTNMDVQVSKILLAILLGIDPEVELLGLMVWLNG